MPEILKQSLIVGMEVHVELATRTKMFTRAPNLAHRDHHDALPNSLVDPVVAALPGTLPVMNKAAVEMSIMVGLALDCTINRVATWDRKNYFYPDLPKGYQISQFGQPLCENGRMSFPREDGTTGAVRITRAHLEEDAGKLGHELPGGGHYEGSLIDLNRAGTPLLEIVTEPDFENADDVVAYCRELRAICRTLGVTEGDMQRGHMRFEPNINLRLTLDDDTEIATPIVEIKNLNSFRAVAAAIAHEEVRQIAAWREDGRTMGPGAKSTRGWDDDAGVTVLQREKEDAHDYRYFPDPDLVPVVVSDAWRTSIAERVPELPLARRRRYVEDYGLGEKDVLALTEEPPLAGFFDRCVETIRAEGVDDAGACAKLLLNAGAKRANEQDTSVDRLGITPHQIAGLLKLRRDDRIGSSAADTLFGLLCETDDDAATVAETEGLLQVSDAGQLDTWIEAAITAQPQAAADFAAGKDAAVGRLMGAVMKASGGKADAKAVQGKLRERLRG